MAQRMPEIQRSKLSLVPRTRFESRSMGATDSRLSLFHCLETGEHS